ncbi:hypothetical protein QE152_g35741 [Popillia japonica]|uniref:Uncharacterized protein n=1 Tax=Popillia japonica TaxID=7064 RepID=A0AAW1IFA7_POPJA
MDNWITLFELFYPLLVWCDMNMDECWRNPLPIKRLAELEGLDEFDNVLVTNEVLSLEPLIDNQSASKERESDEEDEIASPKISIPKLCHVLYALNTI